MDIVLFIFLVLLVISSGFLMGGDTPKEQIGGGTVFLLSFLYITYRMISG